MHLTCGGASDGLAGAAAVAGAIGVAVHGTFTVFEGPYWNTNHFVGVWLAGFNIFFALQAIYVRHNILRSRCSVVSEIVYFSLSGLLSLLHLIGYTLSLRQEGIAWCCLLIITHLHIILVYFRLRTKAEDVFLRNGRCRASCWLSGVCWLSRGFTLLLLAATSAGALYHGVGALRFPPRGELISVEWDDGSGRWQHFHAYCAGPRGNSTFMLDSSASHAMPKFYGVQDALVRLGRRVCVTDKPGAGHASFTMAGQLDFHSVYPNYLRALRERGEGPFILAMEGGGAEMAYWLATRHSDLDINTIVLVDAYPSDYEFKAYQYLNNVTDHELQIYKEQQVMSRQFLANVIKAVACPIDLMGFFLPGKPNFKPKDRYSEYQYHYHIDKTWATQYYMVGPALLRPSDAFAARNLSRHTRLGALVSALEDHQIRAEQCTSLSMHDCEIKVSANRYSINAKNDLLSRIGNNSTEDVYYCTEDNCNMEWFWLVNPSWTAEKLNYFG